MAGDDDDPGAEALRRSKQMSEQLQKGIPEIVARTDMRMVYAMNLLSFHQTVIDWSKVRTFEDLLLILQARQGLLHGGLSASDAELLHPFCKITDAATGQTLDSKTLQSIEVKPRVIGETVAKAAELIPTVQQLIDLRLSWDNRGDMPVAEWRKLRDYDQREDRSAHAFATSAADRVVRILEPLLRRFVLAMPIENPPESLTAKCAFSPGESELALDFFEILKAKGYWVSLSTVGSRLWRFDCNDLPLPDNETTVRTIHIHLHPIWKRIKDAKSEQTISPTDPPKEQHLGPS